MTLNDLFSDGMVALTLNRERNKPVTCQIVDMTDQQIEDARFVALSLVEDIPVRVFGDGPRSYGNHIFPFVDFAKAQIVGERARVLRDRHSLLQTAGPAGLSDELDEIARAPSETLREIVRLSRMVEAFRSDH